jgi:hypothetical protein
MGVSTPRTDSVGVANELLEHCIASPSFFTFAIAEHGEATSGFSWFATGLQDPTRNEILTDGFIFTNWLIDVHWSPYNRWSSLSLHSRNLNVARSCSEKFSLESYLKTIAAIEVTATATTKPKNKADPN